MKENRLFRELVRLWGTLPRNRVIREQTRALEASEAQLRELRDFREQFFANMSHEFRTPLNAIQGFSQTILHHQDRLTRAQILDYVALIEKSSHDLAHMTENVLDLSRLEAGAFTMHLEDVQIGALIDQVLVRYHTTAAAQSVRIRHRRGGNWIIRCDAAGVTRCLESLLNNALKYSAHNGAIDIRAYRDGTTGLIIEVEDQGCGISEEELETVWMIQARPSLTRRSEHDGPGLSLAIVKALIEGHGGSVEIDSARGVGTTVRLCLPGPVGVAANPANRARRGKRAAG